MKIRTKNLGEKSHQKKGVVKEVVEKYTAIVNMIDSGDKRKQDQTQLERGGFIPAGGGSNSRFKWRLPRE